MGRTCKAALVLASVCSIRADTDVDRGPADGAALQLVPAAWTGLVACIRKHNQAQ